MRLLSLLALALLVPPALAVEPLKLADGDRVVFVGNTLFEREQVYAWWELALTTTFPGKKVSFRNLGWSGDTVFGDARAGFGTPAEGFKHLVEHTLSLKPTVIFLAYGTNESFAGPEGLSRFRKGLETLLDRLEPTKARFVLLSPLRQSDMGRPLPQPTTQNRNLRLYADAIRDVAASRKHAFVDLYDGLGDVSRIKGATDNGIHLTNEGYRWSAREWMKLLGHAWRPDAAQEKLRQTIVAKNELYFHRWRPQNVTYLFGFRKHEQGNNAVEIPKFDPLVEAKEKEIWALSVGGKTEAPRYEPPEDVAFRTATVTSEGSRLAAEVFARKDSDGKPLPTIVMCHGWGGLASMLRADAVAFARAGYLVVTFDYRGWGPSEGRLVLAKPATRGKPGEPFTAEVKEIREVVDPLDQTTDLLNVLHWVQGEKQCDAKRIGLWGSSFSGGHVVYAAARDSRVKATVSQVPALDSRWVVQLPALRKTTFDDATKRTRGEIGYPKPGTRGLPGLRGAPIHERLMHYAPVEDADKAPGCAMLFILAEKEELFDNKDHGVKAHARAKGPKKLVTIPRITHYGVYKEARAEAQKLAVEWYDTHLKGGK